MTIRGFSRLYKFVKSIHNYSRMQVSAINGGIEFSDNDICWRGVTMDEIHRNLNEFELEHVPAVVPSQNHTVLHHYPIRVPDSETPPSLKCQPKWDSLHVRMPCSTKSQYPVTTADGDSTIESRWQMIEQALQQPITNSHDLQAAILSYNSKYDGTWNFRALHKLFEDDLDDSETCVFFEDLLPRIIKLALRLPEIVQAPIPLLKQNRTHSLTLTQEQISCLLANAFLCTFPRRNTLKSKSEYSTFPDINFNRLFQSTGQSVLEKIKCICHYFRRVCPTERDSTNVPNGVVTFSRRSLHHTDMPDWLNCEVPLGVTPLHITSEGTIEDQGLGLLQVDFANKFLGGGVLGSGCVQEEIRFVICPELLISKLFTECLKPCEALVMVGAERYSNYTGYAGNFRWSGNHEDITPRDSSRRRMTHIVAIDALHFVQSEHQYREQLMLRELNKAYCGFLHTLETPAPGVASGNWGCGAFGGKATLKALLQLMVCAATGRPLVYFTFGNEELRDDVYRMYQFFNDNNITVKDLWRSLKKFDKRNLPPDELYNFLYSCWGENKHSLINRVVKQLQNVATQLLTPLKATQSALTEAIPVPNTTESNTSNTAEKNVKTVLNQSEDIFGLDDDSDVDIVMNTDATKTVTVSISSSSSSSIQIIQNAEEKLEANDAQEQYTSPPTISSTANTASNAIKSKPQNNTSRQRTLLEMLDQCYTKGPATKRQCTNRTLPSE